MSTVKAGYRITVNSHEVNYEYETIKSVDGIDANAVKFNLELLMLLNGNSEFIHVRHDDTAMQERFTNACLAIVTKHNMMEIVHSNESKLEWINTFIPGHDPALVTIGTTPLDIVQDTLDSFGIRGIDCYTREVESIVVEFIPEEVTYEDVTGNFISYENNTIILVE